MIVGYSLSPGGLLFPWHIGALAGLTYHNVLDDSNPLAGSSAGAIAVTSHGAGVRPEVALDATVRISDQCKSLGGARGNLLPLLKQELDRILDEDVHEVLNNRKGFVGLAYKELFPNYRPVLDTQFIDRDHVIDSVCNSSSFPFFSSNWPCRIARNNDVAVVVDNDNASSSSRRSWLRVPRIAVDGFFSVDRDRFGCPCFHTMDHARNSNDYKVDRTVTLSVFPHDVVSLSVSETHDRISPQVDVENPNSQMSNLLRLATQCAEKEEYYKLYEDGWRDAERWIREEEQRGYWSQSTNVKREIYAKALLNQELN
mmetsp:Transcript_4287/g.8206  ORF Transcript_4287/g.8206 Transcript_4287/m.8206 type:complete len:313 (+) Transcript_4287:81-1019(+)